MEKLKVRPIELTGAMSAKSISLNLTTVLDAQIELAKMINDAVFQFNKSVMIHNCKYDDSEIKSEIDKIKGLIPKAYDDSEIRNSMSKMSKRIQPTYDDSALKSELRSMILDSITEIDQSLLVKDLKLKNKLLSQDFSEYKRDSNGKLNELERSLSTLKLEFKALRKSTTDKLSEDSLKTKKQEVR